MPNNALEATCEDARVSERTLEPQNHMGSSSHISWKSSSAEADLAAALAKLGRSIQELTSQQWDPRTSTIGGIRDYKLCSLAPADGAWSFLLLHLNSELGDTLAKELSKTASDPVVVFYEFEQSAWGFSVYEKGIRASHFWNRPELVEEAPEPCLADAEDIAARFGIEGARIARYLQPLDPDSEEMGKAWEEDRFSLDEHWVRCDFMGRLGLPYPDPGTAGARHVYIEEPGIN